MNVIDIMNNPLAQPGDPGQFTRLVLAQAGGFGMPGSVIAMLDDIAAMLGYYKPLPQGPAGHLAGPLVVWRNHPNQPLQENIEEMIRLAYQQRALVAFGGAPADHMVGTAEIVCAMGNTMRGQTPPEYYEVFQWASVDAMAALLNKTHAEVLADPSKKDWKRIEDAEVIRPGGRLYATCQGGGRRLRQGAPRCRGGWSNQTGRDVRQEPRDHPGDVSRARQDRHPNVEQASA